MANPQLNNGYLKIANELVEALMRINLSPYEARLLWFIIRKTYGFNKTSDRISLSQFAKATLLDRRNVHRALQSLIQREIIVISRDDRKRISYRVQKDYSKWERSSVKMTRKKGTESNHAVIDRDDRLSSAEMRDVLSTEKSEMSSAEIPTKDILKDKIASLNFSIYEKKKLRSEDLTHEEIQARKQELMRQAKELGVEWT